MKHDAWTELKDDIFHSPGRGLMLAILTGSGLQIFCTIVVLLGQLLVLFCALFVCLVFSFTAIFTEKHLVEY